MPGAKLKNCFCLYIPVAFLLLILVSLTGQALAGEPVKIRVGLATGLPQADFRVTSGSYQLIDGATGLPIGQPAAGEKWSVLKEGPVLRVAREDNYLPGPYAGPVLLSPVEGNSELNLFRFKNVRYRGTLSVQNEPAGLVVINVLDVEHYLYGVVGKEMGNTAGLEALKAQAVVSRSYALSMRGSSTRYDVSTDTSTQVYGGYEAETTPGSERLLQAVDETVGQVLYFDGQLVRAFFHANAGGYTENAENVWSLPVPYIKAVPSPQDDWAQRYPVQVEGWPANTFQWIKVYSRSQLADRLRSWNEKNTSAGKAENLVEVGSVLDILVSKNQRDSSLPTASGRVTQLDIVGTQGSKSFFRDGIRPVFDLRSTLFEVEMDSTVWVMGPEGKVSWNRGDELLVAGAAGVTRANGAMPRYEALGPEGTRSLPKLFETLTFKGQGYGHGLGMSQWGARGMAEMGYNYQQIVQHYYNGGNSDGRLTVEPFKQ